MSLLPRISKMKFGVIDEVFMNKIVDSVNEFNSIKDSLLNQVSQSKNKSAEPFLAEITDVFEMTEIEIERFNGVEESIYVAWSYSFKKILTIIVGEGQQQGEPVSQPVFAEPDPPIVTDDFRGDDEDAPSGFCFNLAELSNETTYESEGKIFGIDIKSQSYPEDYLPQPMLVGSTVMLTKNTTENGEVAFFFDRQGVHDGEGILSSETFLVEITSAKVIGVQYCQPSEFPDCKAYKFAYAWNSVTISGVDSQGETQYVAKRDGAVGGTGNPLRTSRAFNDDFYYAALNATEIRSNSAYATGIRIAGDSYLPSYYPMPFGGARTFDLQELEIGDIVPLVTKNTIDGYEYTGLIAIMHTYKGGHPEGFPDEEGVTRYVFNDMMLHDGGCD